MKTILYFNNLYIDNLSELKKLFVGTITEDLRRDLLASFQDGVIDEWLEEGDEECHKILKELSSVDKSDLNQTIERKLIAIFSSKNADSSFSRHIVKFDEHCQIHEISYCKIDKNGNLVGSPVPATSAGIWFKKNEYVGFQMYVVIKITNPDNEVLPIKIEISDSKDTVFDDKQSVSLNTKKNGIVCLTFDVKLGTLRHNSNKLKLKVNDDDIFWSSSLLRGSSFVTLHLDEMRIPLSLVEGQGDITGFYMMRYQATEGFRFNAPPKVYVSNNEIHRIINDLKKQYNIEFRLPSVEEWQYAAKGGIHKNTFKYAGSNNVEDVAWYDCNGYQIQNVGLKKANSLGLFDMSGNVWEMTSDVNKNYRLTCGGSYDSSENYCRTNSLSKIGHTNDCSHNCGFRLICDITSIDNLHEDLVEFEYDDYNNCDSSESKGGFIDMGGSVLWSIEDYTKPQHLLFSDAKLYAHDRHLNSRLPSEKDFEELFANSICEIRNGYYQLKSKINGNVLKLPYQGKLYWTETKDPTVYGDRYEWYVYASVEDQKCFNHKTGFSRSTGRTDVGSMNVISVIKKI